MSHKMHISSTFQKQKKTTWQDQKQVAVHSFSYCITLQAKIYNNI